MTTNDTMNPKAVIKLGKQQWEIGPMKIGTLEKIMPLMATATIRACATPEGFAACITVISAALKESFPEVTEEQVKDIPTSDFIEIRNSVKQIALLCGLEQEEVKHNRRATDPKEETASGEESAEA